MTSSEQSAVARRRMEWLLYSLGLPDVETRVYALPKDGLQRMSRPKATLYFPINIPIRVVIGSETLDVSPGDLIALPTQRPYTIYGQEHYEGTPYDGWEQLGGSQARKALERTDLSGDAIMLAYQSAAVQTDLAALSPRYKLVKNSQGQTITGLLEIADLLRRPEVALDVDAGFLRARLASIIAITLMREHIGETSWMGDGEADFGQDSIIARATQEIRQHPDRPWTLAELAKQSGCSSSTLVDRFRKAFETSPLRFLTAYRLNLAAHKLKLHNGPLSGLARDVGFASESSFSKAFKRQFGVSPSEYRKIL